jgi:hypothetical protein
MRRIVIAITLLLCLDQIGCMSEKKDAIEGTWRLVSGTSKFSDTTYDYAKMGYDGMKMFCDNHFMFVGRVVGNGDTTDNYGGGTFTMEGNISTEVLLYFPVRAMVGDTLSYEVRVSNDTLFQKGPRKIGKYKDSKWELYEV